MQLLLKPAIQVSGKKTYFSYPLDCFFDVRYYVHMQTIHTQNFRIQIWFDCMPDKILLGTISVCAEDEESAKLLAKAHTDYRLIGPDNLNWLIKEQRAIYSY